MLEKLAARAGAVAATTALAALALSGSAQAQPGAAYIGYGQANGWNAVRCVQIGLNGIIRESYATQHELISVDGVFGPETDEAIRYVQARRLGSAEADGIVGPRTGDLVMRYTFASFESCYPYVPTTR
ncbi:peptidoglycan-binding protein [Streptomyces sp. NBC_01077]|uniref:peptidoglycan-binding domain-containing protein n=1 Tax=Streptomyces sp. NBC_01077 TaxID=2903746 RepID=UPI003867E8A9|nr:peptidoglycan-binding protein [Streptomyces sp. NBC_01077]